MSDWKYEQRDPSECLAKLHFFSVKKRHAGGEVEARITVHEYATPEIGAMQFFAMADIELNQKAVKFSPSGWANTLTGALSECLKNMRRFEYQPEAASHSAGSGD
jgi:hypothetical protein